MRLFVALTPPLAVRRGIAVETEEWLGEAADVRCVEVERMHLTLAFLGEIPASDLPLVRAAVGAALTGHTDFELTTGDWGRFPPRGRPRVYWLGMRECRPLEGLARSARAATAKWQRRLADESFRPHLTVARVRGRSVGRLPRVPDRGPTGWVWSAGRVELIRSRLGRGPAVYEVLDRQALTPESAVAPRTGRQ